MAYLPEYVSDKGRTRFPEQAALEELIAFREGALFGPLTEAAMKLHAGEEDFLKKYDQKLPPEAEREDPHYVFEVLPADSWRSDQKKTILELVDTQKLGGDDAAGEQLDELSDDELAALYVELAVPVAEDNGAAND